MTATIIHIDGVSKSFGGLDVLEDLGFTVAPDEKLVQIGAGTGKPVITSNQPGVRALVRHAGLDDKPQGYGRLFGYALPGQQIRN